MRKILSLSCFFALLILAGCKESKKDYTTWNVYGGSKEMIRYSSLTQIDTNNVNQLAVAWTFNSGDADTISNSQIQCNPIIIDSTLYGATPQMKLFALDAKTGKARWVFNPFDTLESSNKRLFFILNVVRGVAYWSNGKEDQRIFYTVGAHLHCINAQNGKLIKEFGTEGRVDLHEGLDREVSELFITSTSPGVVYKDLLIIGSRVDEGAAAAPGHIRAYDVRTGKIRWIFHTIPHPGEVGFDTWEDSIAYKKIGGANSWSGMSVDEKRGIVFVPTGSASFDFYGGKRRGSNLFADCLLALDANTGKRIWHFQQIHHDVWDRDLPTPPALVTITRDGKKIDAVAQPTKTGFVFLFERETGKPLFEIEEKEFPRETELANEMIWPTQPIPVKPPPFVRQTFTENDLNDLLPDSSFQEIKKRFANYKTGSLFTPLSKQGTIIFPGLDGGAEWGGPAFDPQTGILYVNANEMAFLITMVDAKIEKPKNENYLEAGKRLYQAGCMSCHAPNRVGSGNYPSLIGMSKKYSLEQFDSLLITGRRLMPAFQHLTEQERMAIASFVLELKTNKQKRFVASDKQVDSFRNLPYSITGYHKFLTKEGLPAIKPPWGTLNAIDLNKGEIVWKIPLGEDSAFKSKGVATGSENYGGPVVTAGGLVFIAATKDNKIRAFNKRDGKLLWEHELPASGFATPAVFELDGRQYLVIACGGGKLKTRSGDAYVAFALPSN